MGEIQRPLWVVLLVKLIPSYNQHVWLFEEKKQQKNKKLVVPTPKRLMYNNNKDNKNKSEYNIWFQLMNEYTATV